MFFYFKLNIYNIHLNNITFLTMGVELILHDRCKLRIPNICFFKIDKNFIYEKNAVKYYLVT